jgi:hypothetical protein
MYNHGVASLSSRNAAGLGVTVTTARIDDIIAAERLERLDWMKLDIQGGELAALKGASSALRRFRPRILMELDAETALGSGWTEADLRAYFDDVGYSLRQFEGIIFLAEARAAR